MVYSLVSEVPRRSQWEANSAPWQRLNCGPTCVCFIADYYRDAVFPIEATCDLGARCDDAVPGTSGEEQAVMLTKRGVPCSVQKPTTAQLKSLISSGRRPVVVGLNMAAVPSAIRGHSFTGVHAVVARENATVNGVSGVWIMDPNFGYGHTVDTTNGKRFYPDSVMTGARKLADGTWRRAVVPSAPKEVTDVTVKTNELPFIGPDGKPANATVSFQAGKTVTGYALDGTSETYTAPAGGSSAPADARVAIFQNPRKAPQGGYDTAGNAVVSRPFLRVPLGVFADHPYIPESAHVTAGAIIVTPPPPPTGGGFTQADVDKAKAEGKAQGAAETDALWEQWNSTAQAGKP